MAGLEYASVAKDERVKRETTSATGASPKSTTRHYQSTTLFFNQRVRNSNSMLKRDTSKDKHRTSVTFYDDRKFQNPVASEQEDSHKIYNSTSMPSITLSQNTFGRDSNNKSSLALLEYINQ